MMKKEIKSILLGIGNCLRSDDGAGSYIAKHFEHHHWVALNGKSAPENTTSIIKKIRPQLLVIVDATQMGLKAGSFRIIPFGKIISLQLSTHSMPLNFLIEYLTPYCQKIILIGIQPLSTDLGENLSESVLKGCHRMIKLIKENRVEEIEKFSSS